MESNTKTGCLWFHVTLRGGDIVDFQGYKLKVSGRHGDSVNYVYNGGTES